MKKYVALLASVAALTTNLTHANESIDFDQAQPEIAGLADAMEDVKVEKDIGKISKAFGHIIGQNLESLGLNFDLKQVITGIEECIKGEPSPLSESECIQAISLMQENAFQVQCEENLKAAEDFLSKNEKEKNVVTLEPGKLQYVRLQEGKGDEVKQHDSPLIRYVGKFIDGKVFGESTEDEVISLDETIVGFSKSIVGMKEGEKRRIFIHPDFGYGKAGFLPPNSLLTFEIEVIKANSPKTEEPAVSATSHTGDEFEAFHSHSDEIATTDAPLEGVR